MQMCCVYKEICPSQEFDEIWLFTTHLDTILLMLIYLLVHPLYESWQAFFDSIGSPLFNQNFFLIFPEDVWSCILTLYVQAPISLSTRSAHTKIKKKKFWVQFLSVFLHSFCIIDIPMPKSTFGNLSKGITHLICLQKVSTCCETSWFSHILLIY